MEPRCLEVSLCSKPGAIAVLIFFLESNMLAALLIATKLLLIQASKAGSSGFIFNTELYNDIASFSLDKSCRQ